MLYSFPSLSIVVAGAPPGWRPVITTTSPSLRSDRRSPPSPSFSSTAAIDAVSEYNIFSAQTFLTLHGGIIFIFSRIAGVLTSSRGKRHTQMSYDMYTYGNHSYDGVPWAAIVVIPDEMHSLLRALRHFSMTVLDVAQRIARDEKHCLVMMECCGTLKDLKGSMEKPRSELDELAKNHIPASIEEIRICIAKNVEKVAAVARLLCPAQCGYAVEFPYGGDAPSVGATAVRDRIREIFGEIMTFIAERHPVEDLPTLRATMLSAVGMLEQLDKSYREHLADKTKAVEEALAKKKKKKGPGAKRRRISVEK
jgi:hypothetical protein